MKHAILSPKLLEALRAQAGQHWLLAQRVNLHPSTLSNWLRGASRPRPWDSRVPALGALIGVPAEECFVHDDAERVA